ncbi:hypothetical protein [Goodfellowiella coeruleoviolacea]|nr:hypothetical protein [Goodfellowiella coeruleoviolacea]
MNPEITLVSQWPVSRPRWRTTGRPAVAVARTGTTDWAVPKVQDKIT